MYDKIEQRDSERKRGWEGEKERVGGREGGGEKCHLALRVFFLFDYTMSCSTFTHVCLNYWHNVHVQCIVMVPHTFENVEHTKHL